VCALAASLDEHATVYATTLRVQEARTEIIAELKDMAKWALIECQKDQARVHASMNVEPKRIIFYSYVNVLRYANCPSLCY